MLTGLRGLVFKSDDHEQGQTRYTIILGKKVFFPWQYTTATLNKDWRGYSNIALSFNKRDETKYKREIKAKTLDYLKDEEELVLLNEDVEKLPLEEREALRKSIENIPEKIKKGFYEIFEGLLPVSVNKPLYGFEMQNVRRIGDKEQKVSRLESISKKVMDKAYKKAFSVIHILPL